VPCLEWNDNRIELIQRSLESGVVITQAFEAFLGVIIYCAIYPSFLNSSMRGSANTFASG
jgi:hypothetical protein